MKQAHRGLRRSLEETVYLVDSTSLRLNELSKDWARFSSGEAKAQVIYDANAGCPVYMAVTAANVNDITAAQAMPIEAGATTCSTLVITTTALRRATARRAT